MWSVDSYYAEQKAKTSSSKSAKGERNLRSEGDKEKDKTEEDAANPNAFHPLYEVNWLEESYYSLWNNHTWIYERSLPIDTKYLVFEGVKMG